MDTGPGELEDRGLPAHLPRPRQRHAHLVVRRAATDADIEDPAVWRAANPASWLQDGRELGQEFARLKARGALLEWRTLPPRPVRRVARAVDGAARTGRPAPATRSSKPELPVFACVRIAHDHRSAAVAIAQRQGEQVMLRVRSFPETRLPEREYVPAEPIEQHILGLHQRYPAKVTAEVRFHPDGKLRHRAAPGSARPPPRRLLRVVAASGWRRPAS